MKAGAHLKQRDAKKLALANNARLKRVTRKKLEKQTNGGKVTEEMISKALAQRNINQLDDLSRKESANKVVQVKEQPLKNAVSSVKQLPHKALKKNVLWLSPKEQDASSFVSLTEELNKFASYVELTEKEKEARSSMLLDIQDAVKSKFPGASISQFGSHPVGLSIFLSDVDVSVDNINAEVTTVAPHLAITNKAQAVTSQVLVTKRASPDSAPSDSGAVKRSLASTDSLVNKKIKFDEAQLEEAEVSWSLDRSSGASSAPYVTSLPPPTASKTVPTLTALQAMCSSGAKKTGADKAKVVMDDVYDDDVSVASSSTEDCDDSEDSDYMDDDSVSDASNARRRRRRGRSAHATESEQDSNGGELDGDGEDEDEYFNGVLDEYEDGIMEASEQSDEGDDIDAPSDLESIAEAEPSDVPADTNGSAAVSAVVSEMLGAAAGNGSSTSSGAACSIDRASRERDQSSSAAKAPKLAQDIDVPFWDGISPSASNAALSSAGGADGVLDETLAENLYLMDSAVSRAVKATELIDRKEKLNVLQKLQKTIRSMAWVQRLEFRKFARVPIINLTHKNGVECDISLDMSQQATSLVVRALLQRCGPALVKLSAFLKIYLNQLSLDAPFTGGLGSYKLYVLLAKHIERNPQYTSDPANLKLGPLLLSFLKYYGTRFNLNENTVVEVDGAEAVSFDRTSRIGEICIAFYQAFTVLNNVQCDRDAHGSNRQQGGSTAVVIPRPGGSTGHSFLNNQISSSALAMLLNTEHLAKTRLASRTLCHKYPHRSEAERDAVARELLRQLNSRVSDNVAGAAGGATLEEVKASNPALAARLRSFPSAGSAIAHLSYLKSDVHDSKRGAEVQDVMQSIIEHRDTLPPAAAPEEELVVTSTAGAQEQSTAEEAVPNGNKDDPVLDSLEDQIPVLVLQKQYTRDLAVLSPQYEKFQDVLQGRAPLPPNMVVDRKEFSGRLPPELEEKLGPFRTLSIASQYMGKSYPELKQMKKREAKATDRLRKFYKYKQYKVHFTYFPRWIIAQIVKGTAKHVKKVEFANSKKRKERRLKEVSFLRDETAAARECIARYIEEQRILYESGDVRAVSGTSATALTTATAASASSTSASAVASDVVPVVLTTTVPVLTEEAACYQRILELESKVPILLVAEPFSPDIPYREFDRNSADGKRILANKAPLPGRMIVSANDAKQLDHGTQQKLGPFRMLVLAEQYVNKPYLELVRQSGVECAVVAKVRQQYESGGLVLGAHREAFVRRWTIAGLLTPNSADAFELSEAEAFLRDECNRARDSIKKYISMQKQVHDSAPAVPPPQSGVKAAASSDAASSSVTAINAASGAPSSVQTSQLVGPPPAGSSVVAAHTGEPLQVSELATTAASSSPETLLEVLERKIPALVAQKITQAYSGSDKCAGLTKEYCSAFKKCYSGMDSVAVIKALVQEDFAVGEILQMHAQGKLSPDLVGRLAIARFIPRAKVFKKLNNYLNHLTLACVQARNDLVRKLPRTDSYDNATYGQLFVIPPDCVMHRPGVDYSAKQVTALLGRIPTLALQQGLTLELRIFDPNKAASQEILSGQRDLPATMFVDCNRAGLLPEHVRQQLGPFRCIAAAKLFCGKKYDKLYDLLHMEQEALKEVTRLYAARRLRFSHPDHQHLLQLCANARYIEADGETLYIPPTCRGWVAEHSKQAVNAAMNLLDSLEKGGAVPAAVKAPKAESKAKDEAVFNPKSALGMDIIAGLSELPLQMQIPGQFRSQLPAEVLAQLGPFSCLAVAQQYVGRSYAELVREQEALEQEQARLQELYRAGDVDNPAFGATPDERQARVNQLIVEGVLPTAVSKLSPTMKAQRKQALQVRAEIVAYIRELRSRMTPSKYAQVLQSMAASGPSSGPQDAAGDQGLGKRSSDQSPIATTPASAAKKAKADANPHKRKSGETPPAATIVDLTDETVEPVPAEKKFRYFVPSKPAQSASVSAPPTPLVDQRNAVRSDSVGCNTSGAEYVTIAAPMMFVAPPVVVPAASAVVSAAAQATTVAQHNTMPCAVQSPSTGTAQQADVDATVVEISLAKPMVRRGPGGRGASMGASSLPTDSSVTGTGNPIGSAMYAASAALASAPGQSHGQAQSVMQQSREIQESIGAMKQQLDESRKRHSLG